MWLPGRFKSKNRSLCSIRKIKLCLKTACLSLFEEQVEGADRKRSLAIKSSFASLNLIINLELVLIHHMQNWSGAKGSHRRFNHLRFVKSQSDKSRENIFRYDWQRKVSIPGEEVSISSVWGTRDCGCRRWAMVARFFRMCMRDGARVALERGGWRLGERILLLVGFNN